MEGAALIALFVIVYFLPAVNAYARGHRNAEAILALNFFLGWTVLGWLAAFIWSLTQNNKGGNK